MDNFNKPMAFFAFHSGVAWMLGELHIFPRCSNFLLAKSLFLRFLSLSSFLFWHYEVKFIAKRTHLTG